MKTNAFLLVLSFLFATQLNASHVAGGHISYEVTHEDSVKISVDIMRDCSGASWSAHVLYIQISNTCGFKGSEPLVLTSPKYFNSAIGTYSREVSQFCQQQKSFSRCRGGNLPSYEVYSYQGTFHLPQVASCSEWEFQYTPPCCFNTNSIINVLSSHINTSLTATYRPNANRNSSMARSQVPVINACVNTLNTLSLGEMNPDNDSVVYSISPLPKWSNGYAAPNIFGPSTQFDTQTGEISFRTTTTGAYYYELIVCEYDRATGALKGCQSQFGQILVLNCQNHQPGASTFITSVGGAAFKTGPRSLDVCINATYSFSFFVTDSNLADSVFILSDIYNQFSNATIQKTYVSGLKDSLKVTVFDTLPSLLYSKKFDFVVRAYDNFCPHIGQRDIRFSINANAGTYGGTDRTICRGSEWVSLYGSGGSHLKWQVLSGDAFDTVPNSPTYNATSTSHGIGGSISVSPSSRTVYVVTGNLSSSCRQHDTVVVDVAPNFNLNSNYSQGVCYGENVSIHAMPSTGSLSSYTYNWKPRSLFKTTSKGQATSKPIKENTSLWVEAISDSGCVKRDTFIIEVKSLPFPKNIKISPTISQLCIGDTVLLKSNLKNLNIPSCEVENLPCQGSQTLVSSSLNGVYSDSSSSNYGLPNIPQTSANGMKSQVIYRASFLKAMGLKKGLISVISFYVDKVHQADSVLNNLAVKMTCTDSTQFNSINFINDAKQVRSANPDTITDGWWAIEFDQPYHWDGNSNLLIELCWKNSVTSVRNHRMMLLGTSYPAFQNYIDRNGVSNVCNQPIAWQSSFTRFNQVPAIRFTSCQGVNDNGFNFNWYTSSGGGMIGSSSKPNLNFSSTAPGPEKVSLVVRDTSGYCVDTITHEIDVVTTFKIRPLINSPKTACVDASPYVLQAQPLPSVAGLTSNWVGTGIVNNNGLFDPSQAGLGEHTVYYSIQGSTCATSDSFKIKVVPPLDASFGLTKSCITDSAVYLLPKTPNGLWQGPGIVDVNVPYILVDSMGLQLSSGDVDSVTIFHLIDSLGCRTVSQQNVKVFGEFVPQLASLPGINQRFFCVNESARKLVLAQGSGSWSGAGTSSNGIFDPQLAGIGSHTVVVDSNGFCGGSSSYQIEVPQLKNPVISNPGPFCDPQPNQAITITSNHQGSWSAPVPSGSGMWILSASSPKFIPSAVVSLHGHGSYPLTLTVNDTIYQSGSQQNVCIVKDSTQVVFQSKLSVNLGPDIHTCGGVIDTTLHVSPASNILWSTGAIGDSLHVTQPGIYWVEVSSGAGSCIGRDTISVSANCVSIEEETEEGTIKMFPNPTSDGLQFVNTGKSKIGISIHNATGAMVFQFELNEHSQTSISTSAWQSGVYLVQLSSERSTITKRLVVLD